MKNNKNKNQRSANSKKIHAINENIQAYQDSLKLYREFPTLPTLFYLLKNSLDAGVRFKEIEPELSSLIDIEDDQYFGYYGSNYFKSNRVELADVNQFRPKGEGLIYVLPIIWDMLSIFHGDDLYGFDKILVGEVDYYILCDTNQQEYLLSETSNTENNIIDPNISLLIKDLLTAEDNKRVHADEISQAAKADGLPMVPWSALVSDLISAQADLKDALRDFSNYLESYYAHPPTAASNFWGEGAELLKADSENSLSLARIFSFVIFSRLFRKIAYENKPFSLEDYWSERLSFASSVELFDNNDTKSEYIIAISNLLMICSKLGVASTRDGLVTHQELTRDFLKDVVSSDLDVACMVALPNEALQQTLTKINFWEGNRPENYTVAELLRVINYGKIVVPTDQNCVDDMFETAFAGLDPGLATTLKNKLMKSTNKWCLPFHCIDDIVYLYSELWNDEIIIEKINRALHSHDLSPNQFCLFSRPVMDKGISFDCQLSRTHHPALFSRRFADRHNFLDFSDSDWISFVNSLKDDGLIRYACSIFSLYFLVNGFKSFYNFNSEREIDYPGAMRLCSSLSKYDSFTMVRRSIATMFEMTESPSHVLNGSLKAYLSDTTTPSTKINLINNTDRYSKYREDLLRREPLLSRLDKNSQSLFVKGHTLSRDSELAAFRLGINAIQNYLLAVEGELRSRVNSIEYAVVEELKFMGIEIDSKMSSDRSRRWVFRGMGSIFKVLEKFGSLSKSAKERLHGLGKLTIHDEHHLFMDSLRALIKIRNEIQHADFSGSQSEDDGKISEVEELLFGRGKLVHILCATR